MRELIDTSDGEYVPQWVNGKRGTALKFMASSYVNVPDFAAPTNPRGRIDRISFSSWINKTGHCGYGGHLAKRTADRKLGWWIDESHNSNRPEIHFTVRSVDAGPFEIQEFSLRRNTQRVDDPAENIR